MGSPISPLFANMVMDDLETNCLSTLKEKHNVNPLFYFRYVDDTIMCIDKKQIDLVVTTFNSYNNRLQFTYEIEQDKKINFLDMTLIRHNNTIFILSIFFLIIQEDRKLTLYTIQSIGRFLYLTNNSIEKIQIPYSSFVKIITYLAISLIVSHILDCRTSKTKVIKKIKFKIIDLLRSSRCRLMINSIKYHLF